MASEFAHRLVHFGYLPAVADYRALLRVADVVLSTASHEFQGVAVLEAVASGCCRRCPTGRLYPEIYPARFRCDSHSRRSGTGGLGSGAGLCPGGGPGRPRMGSGGQAQYQPLLQGARACRG